MLSALLLLCACLIKIIYNVGMIRIILSKFNLVLFLVILVSSALGQGKSKEIVIQFKKGLITSGLSQIDSLLKQGNCKISVRECHCGEGNTSLDHCPCVICVVRVDAELSEQLLKKIKNCSLVQIAEYNISRKSTGRSIRFPVDSQCFPKNKLYHLQWNFSKILIEPTWRMIHEYEQKSKEHQKVVVGVIDSGICLNHKGLSENILRDNNNEIVGWNFLLNNNSVEDGDPSFHGTSVSSVFGAVTDIDEDSSLAGICWNRALVMPIVAADKDGELYIADIVQGIYYAVHHGARIINCSFSGKYSDLEKSAVDYALQHNVCIVAAAGNRNTDNNLTAYPSAYPGILSVGSSASENTKSEFSNFGNWVKVFGPGEDILAYQNKGVRYSKGTSLAVPHVVGLIALLAYVQPKASVKELTDWVLEGADYTVLHQDKIYPLINALKSMKLAINARGKRKLEEQSFGSFRKRRVGDCNGEWGHQAQDRFIRVFLDENRGLEINEIFFEEGRRDVKKIRAFMKFKAKYELNDDNNISFQNTTYSRDCSNENLCYSSCIKSLCYISKEDRLCMSISCCTLPKVLLLERVK